MCDYTCHKFASNVIEKCILNASFDQLEQIVTEIKEDEKLEKMVGDKFGNFVVQKCLDNISKFMNQGKQGAEDLLQIFIKEIISKITRTSQFNTMQ